MSIFDITAQRSDGQEVMLGDYRGKVILIVNTASKCGFTPQFEELQSLYEKYKEAEFVILGFPSGQFMNQEFDSMEETMSFCQTNYGVTFPMFAKVDVKGEDAHPLFRYLTEEKKGLMTEDIKWNFTKFLVDKDGRVLERYAPQTKPSKIESDIKRLLSS